MKLERVLWNLAAFLLIWVGLDLVCGSFNSQTVSECIAAITMAFMLYFD